MSASVQDTRSFRDFRRRDKLDVRFGMEWQTAEVLEVNWEDPCQNTISLQHLFLSGHLLAVAPTLSVRNEATCKEMTVLVQTTQPNSATRQKNF